MRVQSLHVTCQPDAADVYDDAMARVLMPVPDRDFDPTETAVPWRLLTRERHEVVFATEHGGAAPAGDALLLGGKLGSLGPATEARAFYDEMAGSREFAQPISWSAIAPEEFDGLILPGGH